MQRLGYDPDAFDADAVRDGDDLVGLIVDDETDDDARVAQVAWWCDLLVSELADAPRDLWATASATPRGGGSR